MTKQFFRAEYIWLDGAEPTQQLRSKTRVLLYPENGDVKAADLPEWGFDGSSTYQAVGNDSDLALHPVAIAADPTRDPDDILVMCEVFNPDGTPHTSNQRATLRAVLEQGGSKQNPWFGFEQEYTLFDDKTPLGFPETGFPEPQGPYYCSVGSNTAFGREIVEEHTSACMEAGLLMFGTNAEVMPGQWEFQLGYRGVEDETADPLTTSDQLWLARFLLHRIAEEHGVTVSLDAKPVKGDWNGAGLHTNFSTDALRDNATAIGAIENAVAALAKTHDRHVTHYGAGLHERLTGAHETCSISEFRHGVADRGASIRIPRHVHSTSCGYLEDRRPGANADPYVVCREIVQTVCLNNA